jgi:hypothetical protein
MLRLLAVLIVFLSCSQLYGQTFGLGTSRTSVVSERTFGLSSSAGRAVQVKALPAPLPRPLSLSNKVDTAPTKVGAVQPVSPPIPVTVQPISAVPMICENGVCRPVSQPVLRRLFRRR